MYGAHNLNGTKLRKISADYISEEIFKTRQDIVILTNILKDPINSGIGGYGGVVLDKINGELVESLKHAHELLNPEKTPEFFELECLGIPRPLILPGAKIGDADKRIQKQYGVNSLFNLEN